MKLDVTRNVVSDLWPLCRTGDASADSRALVDNFLAQDDAFAASLRDSDTLTRAVPGFRLSPDAERRLLDDARQRARAKLMVVGAAIGLTGLIALIALGGALVMVAGRL